ncbi:GAF domain-containing protein [Sphingomonas sp. RS6]
MSFETPDEARRVAELKGYGVLDTPNEAEFDAIVREAAAALGVPIALISLIDENRQWFKARVGLEPQETPRSISFCTHAIHGGDVFVVNDASADPRFAENPLVTGDPNIRFYAGAPLRTPTGRRIGTLCVIDRLARGRMTDEDKARLAQLAEKTMEALERRRQRLNAADAA